MEIQQEEQTAKFLSFGLASITIFVYTNLVSDPVNSPKFLLLGVVSLSSTFCLIGPNITYIWKNFRGLILTLVFMVGSMGFSTAVSESPLSQNLYGVQGRNTGFLAHLALVGILLSMVAYKTIRSLKTLLYGLFAAGALNVLYCLWVLLFGDFIQWNNPYRSLLGTLGNPNFISSFLAISGVAFLGYFGTQSFSFRKLALCVGLLLTIIFEIANTKSTQGFVVLAIGGYIIGLMLVFYKVKRKLPFVLYVASGASFFVLGLLGVNNVGPLSSMLYQDTLGYRREYWIAGIRMGLKFPFTGVGMDSYGDWYREMRTAKSMISPGEQVVTNVAHNVYIDAFANGGIPLLLGYVLILVLTLWSIVRSLIRLKALDPLFVALFASWAGFQFQSLISINQLGVVVWGWALSGMLIAYSRIRFNSKESEGSNLRIRRKVSTYSILVPMAATLGAAVGFIVYSPPLLADHKWTTAYAHKSADELYKSLEVSYFNPPNSFKYAEAIQIFEGSNLTERAHDIALSATDFNPRSFDGWQQLYNLSSSTDAERLIALKKMKVLDPRNMSLNSNAG